jgi:uncharacterized protein YrrD
MIHHARSLFGVPIHTADGQSGSVCDMYFNDQLWNIEYFVVKIDGWIFDKQVLIEPKLCNIGRKDDICTPLKSSEIWHCHDCEIKKPSYGQIEEKEYYSAGGWKNSRDVLQSAATIMTYRVREKNGNYGIITDVLFNDEKWEVDRFIVSIGNGLSGEILKIPVSRVERISFEDALVFVS